MSEDDLKTCPFCDNEPSYWIVGMQTEIVMCSNPECKIGSKYKKIWFSPEEWNRRY